MSFPDKLNVDCLNMINADKFEGLLKRLLPGFSDKTLIPFSEEEKEKLAFSLSLDETNPVPVDTVIATVNEIFDVCIYYILKPLVTRKSLIEKYGLDETLADIIASFWAANAQNLVSERKRKSLLCGGENVVTGIDYSINLKLSSESENKKVIPQAIFQFKYHDEINPSSTDKYDSITMNYDQLFQLYEELEKIQVKLDALK